MREYPDRPWIGVGAVAFRGQDVLLVRRGKPPRQGEWSIPGGAQNLGETVEQAARRELREETGVEVGPMLLAAAVDLITPGEGDRPRFHYTILDLTAEWVSGEAVAGDDVTEARWFSPEELQGLELWSEALRVIDQARRVALEGGAASLKLPPPAGS